MRVGPIVDGDAEFRSLPELIPRVVTPYTVLKPLYADMQPTAPIPQIVRAVKSRLHIHAVRGADIALILIDLESKKMCPGAWAQQLEQGLAHGCAGCGINTFKVVVKNRTYENWLVSDMEAIIRMPERFKLSAKQLAQIQPNKADSTNAIEILKTAAIKKSYDKVPDAIRIMRFADPLRIAANSRSFRRFLRAVKNPVYAAQSLDPVD